MNRKVARLPDGAFTGGSVDRLQGLNELIPDLSGHNILDVGAGPGIVAEYLLSRFLCGVTLIEGHEPSVLNAKRALARFGDRAVVLHQNLCDVGELASTVTPAFDTTLFLGIYHHVHAQCPKSAVRLLDWAFSQTSSSFFVRTTTFHLGEIFDRGRQFGFTTVVKSQHQSSSPVNPLFCLSREEAL